MKSNMLKAWRSTILALLAFGAVCLGVHSGKLSETALLGIVPILAPLVFGDVLNERDKEDEEGQDEPN
ncbi:hypothetical protein Q5H93_06280 [Hymenobacter sp. ASUV-10]|uniref:Uncharacterized protein n=1 Tax=Hymenobacter aranciens TaxID=3063996 RepID=A0ABT9BCR2_9BACT|nr:hypothetical protein [Hymenobacter sp. ASUV-10]MDO7874333.1 hypothetical protein [Hymenobacter sp. ASUV-10]